MDKSIYRTPYRKLLILQKQNFFQKSLLLVFSSINIMVEGKMRKGQLKPNRQIPSKVFGFRATVEQASVINLAAALITLMCR